MAEVEQSVEDGIALLALNRPDALNALCGALLDQLEAALGEIEQSPEIQAVILTGNGRAFAAGADIAEIAALDRASGLAFARRGQELFTRIEQLPKPVVAAVNGFALGGGCEIAMACHMRIASAKARFGQPEVKLGILPGFGGTQRLPRLVGRGIATRLILSGEPIRADEALRIGLVDEVCEPDVLLERAHELLRSILANGPRAVAASLAAIRQGLDQTQDEGLETEARAFAELCGSDEMREGTAAFLEKRPPKFR